jgi:hypothetical protein
MNTNDKDDSVAWRLFQPDFNPDASVLPVLSVVKNGDRSSRHLQRRW